MSACILKKPFTPLTRVYLFYSIDACVTAPLILLYIPFLIISGASFEHLALFSIINSAVFMLFDTLTSYLSDTISKRLSICIGFLFISFFYLYLYYISNVTFFSISIIALLVTFANVFISGADMAIFVENMSTITQEEIYKKINNKNYIVFMINITISLVSLFVLYYGIYKIVFLVLCFITLASSFVIFRILPKNIAASRNISLQIIRKDLLFITECYKKHTFVIATYSIVFVIASIFSTYAPLLVYQGYFSGATTLHNDNAAMLKFGLFLLVLFVISNILDLGIKFFSMGNASKLALALLLGVFPINYFIKTIGLIKTDIILYLSISIALSIVMRISNAYIQEKISNTIRASFFSFHGLICDSIIMSTTWIFSVLLKLYSDVTIPILLLFLSFLCYIFHWYITSKNIDSQVS